MKKSTIYKQNDEIGQLKRVDDMLPAPAILARSTTLVKTTISISAPTLAFFKQAAKEEGGKYQTMIRTLLDTYVAQRSKTIR